MPSEPITTIAQLRALPEDGQRHELLKGRHVVTGVQDRQHQSAVRGLLKTLRRQLAARDTLEVMISPSEVVLGSQTLVQPDLFVVRIDPEHPIRSWADVTVPVLVSEVLSHESDQEDRGAKCRVYLEAGVPEYWIVDLDQGQVERWRPGRTTPETAKGMLHWTPSEGASVQIDLTSYFTEVLRED